MNHAVKLTAAQRAILHTLIDNNGEMSFANLAFDIRGEHASTTPQALGRSLTLLGGLGLVQLFRSWDGEHSAAITPLGETCWMENLRGNE